MKLNLRDLISWNNYQGILEWKKGKNIVKEKSRL